MRNETVDVKEWIDRQPICGYQWLILALCFLIVLFDGFDVAVMGFIAPSLLPFLWFLLPESARFMAAHNQPAERIAAALNRLGGTFTEATRFMVGETPTQGKTPLRMLFIERYRTGTLALWTTYFMGVLVIYLTMGWLPTLLRDSGLSIERAASITGLFQIGGTAGAILVGWVMDRRDPNSVIATSYVMGGTFILLLGALSLDSSLLALGVLAAGFCMSGAQTGLNAFAPGYYPTEFRATGVSWMLGIGRFGAIFGSLVGGAGKA